MFCSYVSIQLQDECSMTTVETSDSDKRVLAAQSLDHILHNEHFYELFPNHVEVSFINLSIQKIKIFGFLVYKNYYFSSVLKMCIGYF